MAEAALASVAGPPRRSQQCAFCFATRAEHTAVSPPDCVHPVLACAGDGSGDVQRLSFDPLWRSYTWGRPLPPAKYP